jgi:hypothetical protein
LESTGTWIGARSNLIGSDLGFRETLTADFATSGIFPEYLYKLINFASLYEIFRFTSSDPDTGELPKHQQGPQEQRS